MHSDSTAMLMPPLRDTSLAIRTFVSLAKSYRRDARNWAARRMYDQADRDMTVSLTWMAAAKSLAGDSYARVRRMDRISGGAK